ncbi:hypothetical protein V5O48_018848 [Marasmius crinis-equi]|uniref:Uncharacterized protein n=1 Tax=Marasmius crinis-equi TaxID=585013 RepID=A0ABR3EK09_9AGAR
MFEHASLPKQRHWPFNLGLPDGTDESYLTHTIDVIRDQDGDTVLWTSQGLTSLDAARPGRFDEEFGAERARTIDEKGWYLVVLTGQVVSQKSRPCFTLPNPSIQTPPKLLSSSDVANTADTR